MLSDKTANEAFEVILRQALIDDCNREFDKIEVIQNVDFSNKYRRNINKIHRIYKRNNKKKLYINKPTPKIAAVAASVLLAISLALNPHVQAAVKEIFERVFGRYTQHEFYSNVQITEENFNYDIKPQYVPDGFFLSEADYMTSFTMLTYVDFESDQRLILQYAIANETDFAIDNEHSKKQDLYVKDSLAIFYQGIENDQASHLIWVNDGYSFMLSAQTAVDEIVKIAESLTFD